jgi:alkanesulfonate monooxygenase SsuD/methylene tetrahydromethanopterin reductase-like flavin-dependent oxidoreductase (luciferase family)
VKFGIFDHLDRNGDDLPTFYEQRLQLCEIYDREGFSGYHLAEHHSTPIGLAPSPSVFLSAVVQRTRKLRMAPLVYLLPFYHPIRLIEEICMLDQMSGGRYEIGVGRGISPIESSFYGVDAAEGAERYAESLAIVSAGLRESQITFHGKFYELDNVPLEIAPFQRPFPRFWYGVHAPESAQRAARAGFHVVTNEGPVQTAAIAAAYGAEWQSIGESGDMPEVGVVRHIVVADTDEQALALARPAYAQWYENLYHLHRRYGRTAVHGKATDLDGAVVEGTAIVGSPETVARVLAEQFAASGFSYLLGQFAFGNFTAERAKRSIGLFTEKVRPMLIGLGREVPAGGSVVKAL